MTFYKEYMAYVHHFILLCDRVDGRAPSCVRMWVCVWRVFYWVYVESRICYDSVRNQWDSKILIGMNFVLRETNEEKWMKRAATFHFIFCSFFDKSFGINFSVNNDILYMKRGWTFSNFISILYRVFFFVFGSVHFSVRFDSFRFCFFFFNIVTF